ncbi:MAG: hypothetical protein RBU37_08425 [Myxococcota bacterium]|jgi:hypothetical protein|nr:hypothetical protein [Myxococcota bacterium]
MADEKLEQILEEQKALNLLAEELPKTTEPHAIETILAALAEGAQRLEGMAQDYAQGLEAAYPESNEGPVHRIEVVLTPEQRQRVFDETGIEMGSVLLDDPTGERGHYMPSTEPQIIEAQAIKQALGFKQMVEAEEASRQALEAACADLEENGTPEQKAAMEKIKADLQNAK